MIDEIYDIFATFTRGISWRRSSLFVLEGSWLRYWLPSEICFAISINSFGRKLQLGAGFEKGYALVFPSEWDFLV